MAAKLKIGCSWIPRWVVVGLTRGRFLEEASSEQLHEE